MSLRRIVPALALSVPLVLAQPGAVLAQVETNVPAVEPGARPVTVQHIKVHGAALEGNLEGNAVDREVIVLLPPSYQTSLSGDVELYSSRLRYRDGRVDTRYNTQETIAWVITDYLQRSSRRHDVQLQPLPLLDLNAERLDLEVEAQIAGVPRRSSLSLSRTEMHGWRVSGDREAPLPEPSEEELLRTAPVPTTIVRGDARPLDRRIGFSLERLLDAPSRYLGARMQVLTERGRSAEGRFAGINEKGRLVIQHSLGGQGEASFLLRPSEVTQIELLEP